MASSTNGGRSRAPRAVKSGDVIGSSVEANVQDRVEAAQQSKAHAIQEIVRETPALVQEVEALMQGASADDLEALKDILFRQSPEPLSVSPDDELAPNWRKGGYPYRNLMSRKNYEKQKYYLQVELLVSCPQISLDKPLPAPLFVSSR